jgi:hypothetical protein
VMMWRQAHCGHAVFVRRHDAAGDGNVHWLRLHGYLRPGNGRAAGVRNINDERARPTWRARRGWFACRRR